MAGGNEVAVAYVTLIPKMKGIAEEVNRSLSGAGRKASEKFSESFSSGGPFKGLRGALGKIPWSSMAKTAGQAFGVVAKTGAAAVGTVGTAVAGLALGGGFSRALNVERAQTKLKGLGYDTEKIKTVMENASAAVQDTAFGLDEAANAGAMLSASGISAGKDLQDALTSVADVAQMSGRSMGDIGLIFSSIAARGKLQGDDMLQLMSSGIPVTQLLAKELGTTSDKVSEMVSRGEIDFATFQRAMESGVGGAAKSAGETFDGAFANMKTSIKSIGEVFATPIMEGLRDVFNAVKDFFKTLKPLLEPLGKVFGDWLAPKVEKLVGLIESLTNKLSMVKVPTSFNNFGDTLAGLAPVLGALAGVFAPLLSNIPIIGRLLTGLTGPVGLVIGIFGGMLSQSSALRDALGSSFKAIGNALIPLGPIFAKLSQLVGQTLGILGDALAPVVKSIGSVIAAILPPVLQIVSAILPPLQSLLMAVTPILSLIGEQIAWLFGLLEPLIDFIASILVPLITMISWIVETALNALVPLFQGVVNALSGVFNIFAGIFTGDWSRVWQGVKTLFIGIWNGIKGFFTSLWGSFKGIFSTGLAYISSIWIQTWNGIKLFFSTIWSSIKGMFSSGLAWIRNIWSSAWNGIRNVFTSVWNGLKRGAQAGWNGISSFFSSIPSKIRGFFSGAGRWLWNIGKSIINGLLGGLKSMWQGVKNWFSDLTSWIPKWKGPADVDRKLLVKPGQLIMEGFQRGLSSQYASIRGSLLDFTSSLAITPVDTLFTSPQVEGLQASLAANSSRGNVNVVQHIESNDPSQVARMVSRRLLGVDDGIYAV